MEMKSLLQRQTEYNNRTVYTTVLSQMENIKEKMINCNAQAIQLQKSSQNRGEEAQEQIRIVQQDREDNRSELDSWTTKGRWP
jgi:hypothetical protein